MQTLVYIAVFTMLANWWNNPLPKLQQKKVYTKYTWWYGVSYQPRVYHRPVANVIKIFTAVIYELLITCSVFPGKTFPPSLIFTI